MAKVRLFYRQVWDENGNLHEIKTASEEELENSYIFIDTKWIFAY